MVFAELPRCVAERFENCRDRDGLVRQADIRSSLTDSRHACPQWNLAGDEIGAASGTTCLGIIVGEAHALGGELVEVGRFAGHDALMIGTDIKPADIIAHDNENVRLLA